jgi:hypothetical protein
MTLHSDLARNRLTAFVTPHPTLSAREPMSVCPRTAQTRCPPRQFLIGQTICSTTSISATAAAPAYTPCGTPFHHTHPMLTSHHSPAVPPAEISPGCFTALWNAAGVRMITSSWRVTQLYRRDAAGRGAGRQHWQRSIGQVGCGILRSALINGSWLMLRPQQQVIP